MDEEPSLRPEFTSELTSTYSESSPTVYTGAFFPAAQNFVVNGGVFTSHIHNYYITHIHPSTPQAVAGLPGSQDPPAVASDQSPVFIYYKLYDDNMRKMIPCKVGHANDPCIGRIDACQIPTPYTIGALAEHICSEEGRPIGLHWDHDAAYGTMLLRTVNSAKDYALDDKVDLLGADRPGSTPEEPVLLKVWYEVVGSPGWETLPARSVTSHRSPTFIYYKVYDDNKKEMIRCAVGNTGDPFLGRVDTCQICTPHTIGALAEHISKQENRPIGLNWDHDKAYGAMLLRAVDSPNAYEMDDAVDLLDADRPGSTPQEPVFLKVWCEDLQAVLGFSEWETPVARRVDSHRRPTTSAS
ncbi:hypothetical protein DFH08DRAFT_973209 [Mycena albidolilacea]|uniref:Uncharacterized protein n=1 Tax=Mycena albidolilacea TaxID=1033008 RepID=A0AAD6Z9D4_9AGAR|nr:hypothetical protein DFH08DRAFT_973209 [Mycena albidolilacea]